MPQPLRVPERSGLAVSSSGSSSLPAPSPVTVPAPCGEGVKRGGILNEESGAPPQTKRCSCAFAPLGGDHSVHPFPNGPLTQKRLLHSRTWVYNDQMKGDLGPRGEGKGRRELSL